MDGLYALPLSEFTAARNALAKRLRADGEREAAAEVAAARKPTTAAWAVNQLVRREPERIAELVKVGEELRAAQQRLLGGGDSAALVELSERERGIVRELVEESARLLRESGARPGEAVLEEIGETLHAAALDEEVAAAVTEGRLTRERRAVGLGLGAGPAPKRKRVAPKRRPSARVTKARERLEAASAAAREAAQAADRATRVAEQARRAAEQAAERERRAAEALAQAERS